MTGHGITALAVVLLAVSVALEIWRELCFKAASNAMPDDQGFAVALARQPLVWAGIGLSLIGTVCWVLVLQIVPLTVAFSVMASTYAGIPLASAAFLKERLGRSQVLGAAFIAAGVLCIGLAGG